MKGAIYTSEKCSVCNSGLLHDENKDRFLCKADPNHKTIQPEKLMIRFGRDICSRFCDYKAARQFLGGLRWKTVEGSFDARDYKKNNPLGYQNQVAKYLSIKKDQISIGQFRNIKRYLNNAGKLWGQQNVKTLGYAEIEDYLFSLKVSDKTRSNARSALFSFFNWLNRREGIPVPDMPEIKFELGWRNIIDLDTQQSIIDEVKRISFNFNPKIWIGIRWLSTYVALRPNELRHLRERHINVSGFFVIPSPKEKEPKLVAILPEDIELYHSIKPRGLPDLYFFRHIEGNGSAKPGAQFGKDYLYKWWKKACSNLGIGGVDLYGGTRHSTSTALSEHFSEQEIMDAATMHKSNKAAQRYIQARKNNSINIYAKVREMQGKAKILDIKKARKRSQS